ncbi:MAG: hypothetical protein JWQ49_1879 [Edaphobacter sp.]|nr:hypothetical protein [Edaphobacter sp.]
MTDSHETLEAALGEIGRLQKLVSKGRSRQVSSAGEIDVVKAHAQTWFRTRRPILVASLGEPSLQEVDEAFREILSATHRATSRTRYIALLKLLRRLFSALQADKAIELSSPIEPSNTSDAPPSFGAIAADAEMQRILISRWEECVASVGYGLPIAATVMLGGLLEAVLIARINKLPDQSTIFKAKAAPKDKAGTVLKLREWTLNHYIDVANEVGWISDTYKDVGAVLRDYRNYIHPYKEYQHKKTLTPDDAKVLWEIGKTMMRQVLKP